VSQSLLSLPPARTITDAAQLGTVLGIWAHPDDEAFLSAGLMAAARDAGQRVVCVTATLGEGTAVRVVTVVSEATGVTFAAALAVAVTVPSVGTRVAVGETTTVGSGVGVSVGTTCACVRLTAAGGVAT